MYFDYYGKACLSCDEGKINDDGTCPNYPREYPRQPASELIQKPTKDDMFCDNDAIVGASSDADYEYKLIGTECILHDKNGKRVPEQVAPIVNQPTPIKGMAPGQSGGMIGTASKDIGAKVGTIGQGLGKNISPVNNNTMFGNIAVKEGAQSPYAKMAEKAPAGAPPSQYGAAKPLEGPPAAPGTYGTAKPLTDPAPGGAYGAAKDPVKAAEKGPAPVGAYGTAQSGMIGGKIGGVDLPGMKEPPKMSGAVMLEQIKKGELPTGQPSAPPGQYGVAKSVPPSEYGVAKGPAPMMKEDAVKAMAPGQMGGMIGGASKEMGGDVKMIGKGLAEKMDMDIARAKEVPMASKEVKNIPEAIAKKVDPEVKKIVDSFGKPAPSEVEQKKMEAMKQMGVAPPKDAKDMEDLRKGIYRPDGKEIPGTALFDSFKKDLAAFASMLMKMVGGNQSGYTSGEMFGSTNSLILIALVVAIVFASRR